MTPAEIISETRKLVNDSRPPQRYSDTDMLGFVNQAIRRMVVLRPDLFAEYDEISTTAGAPLQTMPSDSVRLIELYQVKGGNALTEVNRTTMDQGYPNWVSDVPGTPYNFMRHVRNANKYFLYPRPMPGIILMGEYAKVPPLYGLDDDIDTLPEAYAPILVDGTTFLASAIDDEHVNSGRAKLFLDSFTGALEAGVTSRILTDTKSSGLAPEEVI